MTSCHRALLAFSLLGILSAPCAWGQITTTTGPTGAVGGAPNLGGLSTAIKNALIIDAASETQIKAFVSDQLAKFREANSDGVPRARDALVNDAKGGSAAFLAKYAEILNAEMLSVLKDVKEMRPRLNAAIVIARVAEIANNTKLEKSVLALLDKNQPEALKLWGMRAARPILPELIKVNGEKPLIDAIITTVKQFPDNGPLAEDAYDALNPRTATAKAIPTIVDALLDLTAWRLDIYKNGIPGGGGKTLLPDLPEADSTPFANILFPDVWKALDKNKKQDVRTMQLAVDLMHWSAIRGETAAYRQYRDQLQASIKQVSGGVYVAASVLNEPNVANLAKGVSGSAGQQAINLEQLVQPLCEAIPKMKGFESVTVPPPAAPVGAGQETKTASDGAGAGNTGPTVQQTR